MIRVLVIIAVTGFFVSIVCLTAAVGIAGPDVLVGGAWPWNPAVGWIFDREDGGWRMHHRHWRQESGGAQTTREIAWSGGDAIDVELPAEVQYTQSPGPAKLAVTGPQEAVADVEIVDGHIRLRHDHYEDGDLRITITAPAVTRFEMSGSGRLDVSAYRQNQLTLDLSGDADVRVAGEANLASVNISGSGDADLGELKAKSADVDISGSGDATIAPSEAAKIDISGSGDVSLRTDPPKLETNVSGSGSVRRETGERAASAAAPASTQATKRPAT
jgi:hypothetical protein